ncbi:ATP/GTP-binding protein [Pseudomonas guariconensis]|uniref:AAA family ATPase n=1 Tax=Pseudomonas guariconensis TaxID=1288410 RepID=UPI0036F3C208
MLHTLRFSNFYSFLDEVEVSFAMDGRAAKNEKSCESEAQGGRYSKILAVVGANGAGKTNVIKPFAFITWFLRSSFVTEKDDAIYVRPHFFREDESSNFELTFEVKSRVFKYELRATPKKVVFESLQEKTSRLWSTLFTRELEENGESYNIKQRGFGFDSRVAIKTKKNASLIAAAAHHDVPIAVLINDEFSKVSSNINAMGRNPFTGFHDVISVTSFYEEHEKYKDMMVKHLKDWDLGLSDVSINRFKHLDPEGEEFEVLMPFGIHTYNGKKFEMPLLAESSGTQAAYVLLSKLLPVLDEGGVVVYDELEADLHPHMLDSILELFFNPKTNPHNAQIIFTTHSVEILNELQKCQILLVEKRDGVSDAWKLSDMAGVRSDDNFYAKYMSGTYGAVPNF